MTQDETTVEAISLLQDLGLQEYEARCFMALNKLPNGTAKEIHEISDVPRTRVYDAIRVLESQGLVEVQHSSPQRYRSVEITEATRILRERYNDRIDTLERYLEQTDVEEAGDDDHLQEIWSLSGHEAIESRTLELIGNAESEIALLVVDDDVLSEALFDGVQQAIQRDLTVVIGGQTPATTTTLKTRLPETSVFETEMEWLTGSELDAEVAISRILLVDQETLLIGTYYPAAGGEAKEQAVFAKGLQNGVVVLLRRLVTAGLSAIKDPGK
ncbi:transcriptional regulator, TrmB [Haloterrigena turkmenica DSM 5511]|uniref:Transcriptional regulator, TrmB n=1 Tax=Haloterrigena turkmenica (strain ATCC 51198 / DSM 5511 / JCM 9101 / NCIMB 13204 / VKM B-1734 / 4k) TaxID=543526 RepID=D2RX35_HALTV|nr:helix-turn-helix domain-containing protein [Haloterrigena turkmenica]ADB59647.1 transcriptional regulator, TrmB [Haloterrigena turkmenica DSM 5511]